MALRFCFPLLLVLLPACLAQAQDGPHGGGPPWAHVEIASSHQLKFGSNVLQVDFAVGPLDLPVDAIMAHVEAAASAVATYYGQFPVSRARLLLVPVAGRSGIMQGTTWGNMGGFQGFTRIRIGQHTTASDLAEDWMTTHELTHMGFPAQEDDQHWIEEGLATYVEPIARVETGELKPAQIWHDMVRDMHKGEPEAGDLGVDRTHTWGRTYWGGAMFCLVADVNIRRQTHNAKGLQDALRAIVAQGGTIDHDWPLDRALTIGDQATGTQVLTKMYSEWKDTAVTVDLPKLWSELGIRVTAGGEIEFVTAAPLASVREAIAKPVPHPLKPERVP